MELCFEVRLEEDRTNIMGVLTTPMTNSAVFSVQSPTHDNDKNNGKKSLFVSTARNSGTSRILTDIKKMHGLQTSL